ncbi:hypothetical protein IMSHALPRED_006833 [Imshaugia aleurites]|uniref:Uncharacterized protein n=1 Tax=Imshaugia aleurites TaxID=172621 RepID=A0A8H3FIW2_9LECA|nr:hypothetical protein IMSHALPRED_006833 [Imshaugia aleurites]
MDDDKRNSWAEAGKEPEQKSLPASPRGNDKRNSWAIPEEEREQFGREEEQRPRRAESIKRLSWAIPEEEREQFSEEEEQRLRKDASIGWLPIRAVNALLENTPTPLLEKRKAETGETGESSAANKRNRREGQAQDGPERLEGAERHETAANDGP